MSTADIYKIKCETEGKVKLELARKLLIEAMDDLYQAGQEIDLNNAIDTIEKQQKELK